MAAVEKCGGEFHFPASLFSALTQAPLLPTQRRKILKTQNVIYFTFRDLISIYPNIALSLWEYQKTSSLPFTLKGPAHRYFGLEGTPPSKSKVSFAQRASFLTLPLPPLHSHHGASTHQALNSYRHPSIFTTSEWFKSVITWIYVDLAMACLVLKQMKNENVSQINRAFRFRFKVCDFCKCDIKNKYFLVAEVTLSYFNGQSGTVATKMFLL